MLWKGFQRPKRLDVDRDSQTARFGRFTAQPFERGWGTTIGNAMRRVLLSSIEGAAITAVKIEGVQHEFSPVEGVVEDATDIILNLKQVPFKLHGDETKMLYIRVDKPGPVLARGEVVADPALDVDRGADVERRAVLVLEHVDPRRRGQTVGQEALAALSRRHSRGVGAQLLQGADAETTHPLDEAVQHIDRGLGVVQGAVIGRHPGAEHAGQGGQLVVGGLVLGHELPRQMDRVED